MPMSPISEHLIPASLLTAVLLPLCACAVTVETTGSGDWDDSPGYGEAVDEEAEQRGRLVIEIAQLTAAADLTAAELEKSVARRDLTNARRDLEVFLNLDRPLRLAEQELAVVEARDYMETSEVELAELEEMYAQHPADPKTAELVMERSRSTLEGARLSLAVEEQRLVYMVDGELPGEERGYREAVDEAEAELEQARRALKLVRQQTELDILDAWEESGLEAEAEGGTSGDESGAGE